MSSKKEFISREEALAIAEEALIDYLGLTPYRVRPGEGDFSRWGNKFKINRDLQGDLKHIISDIPMHKTLPIFEVGVPIISAIHESNNFLMSTVIFKIRFPPIGSTGWLRGRCNVNGVVKYIEKRGSKMVIEADDYVKLNSTTVSYTNVDVNKLHPNKSEFGWLDVNTFQYYIPNAKSLFMNWNVSPFN